jgi:transposase
LRREIRVVGTVRRGNVEVEICRRPLLRALLLQALYTIRSERLLMEEIDDSILFRWFIGLSLDEPIWSPTVFSKNRDRLLQGDIASAFVGQKSAQSGSLNGCHETSWH